MSDITTIRGASYTGKSPKTRWERLRRTRGTPTASGTPLRAGLHYHDGPASGHPSNKPVGAEGADSSSAPKAPIRRLRTQQKLANTARAHEYDTRSRQRAEARGSEQRLAAASRSPGSEQKPPKLHLNYS